MERVLFVAVLLLYLSSFADCQTVGLRAGTCTSSTCNFGRCMQTNSSHMQCLCRKGYSGVDCSVPVDECSLNLCRNNGSCLNRIPPAGFQCVCMPQFSGVYCEKAYDVCQEQPCLNGGACRPTSDGGFHCDCPPDFTGSRCQDSADQCSSAENPCMGRGQCRNRNGSFVCDCAAAYAGEHCEQTLCSAQTMNPCQNGKCLLDEHNTDGFRCNCSLGFKGSLCEENIDDCIGVSCSGHGLCIDDIGKYRCLCLPGYSGFNCDIAEAARAEDEVVVLDHCMSNPCDHGACLNRADGFSCICDPAWRGRTCSETDCSTTSCLNGGTCVVMVGGQAPVCLCDENWLGSRCEVAKDPCQNSPCQNGGLCAPLASNSAMKLECLCQPDYGGYYCEYRIDDCKGPARCLNGGTCQDGIGNFTCLCPASFTGWRCDIAQFSSSTTIATTSWPSTAILPTSTSRTSPATVSPSTPMQRTVSTSSPVTSSRLPSSGGLIIVMPTKRPPYNRTVSATAVITIPQAVVNTATVMLGFGQINVTSFRNPTLRPANTQSATVPSIQSVLSALSRTTASSTVTTQTSSPTLKLASTSSSPSSLTTSQQTSTAVILAVTVNTLNRPTLGSQALPLPYDVENSDMPLEGVANAVGVPDLPLQVAVNPLVSCPPTFCRNGGLCRIDQSYRFRCDCPLRFVGDVCEDEVLITRPHFAGNGYLRYNLSSSITAGDWDVPPGYFEVALRFSVDPASSTANATLIEAGSAAFGSQSIQLVMVNRSRLNLSVSCGSQGLILLLEVTSNVASTNADAPSVLFLATQLPTSASSNCSAVLRWGSSSAQRSLIVQSLSSSSASLDYVLLGGSPFSASNFSGSLSNLQINKKDVDFDVDVHSGYNVLQGSLNTCWRVQCRNNGTCLESATGWMCACTYGFTGVLCELEECAVNPCLGGSTCLRSSPNETSCVCPLGRYGVFCEKVYTATADLSYFGNVSGYTSFSTFPPIIQRRGHLEIAFNFTILPDRHSSDTDGSVLLTVGAPELISQDSEYVFIGMKQKAVVAICNLGGGPLVLIPSTRLVPNTTFQVTLALNRSTGIYLTVGVSGRNDSTSRLDFPPNYYFRKFPYPAQVSVGGYSLIDVLPLPGFHGFTGSISGLQFRTRWTGAFTPFSRPTGGRNVLPAAATDQEAPPCLSCPVSLTSCTSHQCATDSSCAPDLALTLGGYRCDCPLGKSGRFCQAVQSIANPSFNGLNSYLTFLPTSGLQDGLMVQFDVKAGAGSGFLLYAAEYPTEQTMSFLSLFMASWTLYFRFNVGNDVTKSISLPLPSHVMDQWISVEVGKNASLAWMTVDGRTTTADLSQVSLRQLRIFTHLYVGGVPSSIRTAPSAAVAGLSSFDGCIAALSINKRALAVAEALGGLNVADCQGERCASARCTSLADGVGGWPLTVQPEGPSFVTIAEPRYQQVKRTLSYLSLSFRTGQSDGMLIWTGKVVNSHSDYLGLGLVGGYMQVVLNLGWQSKRALLSPPPQRYDDNSWHHMIFSREGSNLSLIMDASSFLNANVFVPGSYKELDTDGLYHLGSFPSGLSLYQETLGYFSRPFTGCISNVTFAADTPLQPLSSSPFDNIQPFTRCFN